MGLEDQVKAVVNVNDYAVPRRTPFFVSEI